MIFFTVSLSALLAVLLSPSLSLLSSSIVRAVSVLKRFAGPLLPVLYRYLPVVTIPSLACVLN